MSERKHTPGELTVDSQRQFLFGRCIGGVRMEESTFPVADIRGWGHLQYRDDGAEMQKANADRLALCWNSHDLLVEALKKYADRENWGYTDDSGCEKGHGKYTDACFIGPEVADHVLEDVGENKTMGGSGAESLYANRRKEAALKAAGEEV